MDAVETVFREHSGRILATLIRIAGSFDLAEEAVQEAFAAALVTWPRNGVPDNSPAWIMAVARRKLIDAGRHERMKREKEDAIRYEIETAQSGQDDPSEDDRLRLMFTCCHPAINREAQIALTLRTLGGLTTPEIAKAFLVPEATLAQRLVRAKRKIQEARIPYVVPPLPDLPERLASVQAVLYLIFNEGYAAAMGDRLVRADLCAEAIRLGRVLCELMSHEAESLGLLALMLLHDSRRNARVVDGKLVTLEEQDRSLWDRSQSDEGLRILDCAVSACAPGPYQLQAAIAALHTQGETDWPQICAIYVRLMELNPSPVVALNHCVAVAMAGELAEGLRRIDELQELDGYYLFHAARADILRRMGNRPESSQSYRRALNLATNRVEREFLQRRLDAQAAEKL